MLIITIITIIAMVIIIIRIIIRIITVIIIESEKCRRESMRDSSVKRSSKRLGIVLASTYQP